MRIAILSDSHDQKDAVWAALELIAEQKVDLLLHCGDIDDVETVLLFGAQTHFVLGNCDHDRARLRRAVADIGATLHEPYGRLEIAGVRIAFVHGDDQELLGELASNGQHDLVCHGHTHLPRDQRQGATRIINPGALYRARPRTVAVLDLASGSLTSLVLG